MDAPGRQTAPTAAASSSAASASTGSRHSPKAAGKPPAGKAVADDSQAKGTARLAGLRLQNLSSGDGSSVIVTAVRQLEQRIETERRHTERQIQRLERQVEELTTAPTTGGRWAELQGYVDGLAETVQDLVRRHEDPSRPLGAPAAATSSSDSAASSQALSSLGARLRAVEMRQSEMSSSSSLAWKATQEQLDDACRRLDGIGASESSVDACHGQLQALRHQVETLSARIDSSESTVLPCRLQLDQEASQLRPRPTCLADDFKDGSSVSSSDRRSDAGGREKVPREMPATGRESSCSSEESFRERSEMVEEQVADVCDQVDELHSQVDEQLNLLHDRLADVEARLQETESGLQDIQLDHDVRLETTHVSEQVLRLAMRMQRLENGGFGSAMSADMEELRHFRAELGDFSEQLLHLASRLTQAEHGLGGIAEAIGRVCEELAQLRGDRPAKRRSLVSCNSEHVDGDADDEVQANSQLTTTELEASQQSPPESPDGKSTEGPLQHKVAEMERSLECMAEVVFGLRKQVTSLRNNFASLQSNVLNGEDMSGDAGVQEE